MNKKELITPRRFSKSLGTFRQLIKHALNGETCFYKSLDKDDVCVLSKSSLEHLVNSKIEECAVTAENEKVDDIQNDGDWHYNNGCDAGANAIRKRYFIIDSDEY